MTQRFQDQIWLPCPFLEQNQVSSSVVLNLNSQPQSADTSICNGATGFPVSSLFTAGKYQSSIGIEESNLPGKPSVGELREIYMERLLSETSFNQQITGDSLCNLESFDMNEFSTSLESSETSRTWNFFPDDYYPHYPVEMNRRRHSSDLSINSRCETPCAPDSEASSPSGIENFNLNNFESLPIFCPEYLSGANFGSDILQAVPEMLGVQNNHTQWNNSQPDSINNEPLPPYHYPHNITENKSSYVQRAPPSYSSFNWNKVHRRAPPPYSISNRNNVQQRDTSDTFLALCTNSEQELNSNPCGDENTELPQETVTEAILRIFGRPRQTEDDLTPRYDKRTQLWQFLIQLLRDSRNSHIICWEGDNGEFRVVQPKEVAAKWGEARGKKKMNYDKLSRALRYYYDKHILAKDRSKKFVYQFLLEGLLNQLCTPKISDSEFIYSSE